MKLSGWQLNVNADEVIIITHFGYRANRYGYQVKRQLRLTRPYKHEIEFAKVARRLIDAGYYVLMYDLRNRGESEKSKLGVGTGGVDERHDVFGAVEDDQIATHAKRLYDHLQSVAANMAAQGGKQADPQEVADKIFECVTSETPVHNPIGADAEMLAGMMSAKPRQEFLDSMEAMLLPPD